MDDKEGDLLGRSCGIRTVQKKIEEGWTGGMETVSASRQQGG